MNPRAIKTIVEEILEEKGHLLDVAVMSHWEIQEHKPNHYTVSLEIPDRVVRSISFSASPKSTYESIRADVTHRIQENAGKIAHKGYRIHAKPYRLKSGKWSLNIDIVAYRSGGVHVRNFTGLNTFKTEVEAIHRCFHFGQQIIDGKVPNCSIEDL